MRSTVRVGHQTSERLGRVPDPLHWLLFVGVGAALYWPGFSAKHFADDFQFIFDDPIRPIWYWLIHSNPYNRLIYRPIEAVTYAAAQAAFGTTTVLPLHLENFFVHAALAWFIVRVAAAAGFTRLQSVLAGLYFLVAEVQVEAVAGLDTFSQVIGAAFGFASVTLLATALWDGTIRTGHWRSAPRRAYLVASIVAFLLSLLSKETSFGFFCAAAFLITLWTLRQGARMRTAVRFILPYVMCAGSVIVLRWVIGASEPGVGDARYDFKFDRHIAQNVIEVAAGWVLPIATVDVYQAVGTGDARVLAWGALLTGVLVLTVACGLLWASREEREAVVMLLVLAMCAVTPAIFIHVSELYVYNSMPYISLVVGVGLGSALRRLRWGAFQKQLAGAIAVVGVTSVYAANGIAVREKVLVMRRQGDRAAEMLNEAAEVARTLPPGATLTLRPEPTQMRKYSVFLTDDFDTIETGLRYINRISGRDDIRVRVSIGPTPQAPEEGAVMLLKSNGPADPFSHDAVVPEILAH
jgi:hypothetical protein